MTGIRMKARKVYENNPREDNRKERVKDGIRNETKRLQLTLHRSWTLVRVCACSPVPVPIDVLIDSPCFIIIVRLRV